MILSMASTYLKIRHCLSVNDASDCWTVKRVDVSGTDSLDTFVLLHIQFIHVTYTTNTKSSAMARGAVWYRPGLHVCDFLHCISVVTSILPFIDIDKLKKSSCYTGFVGDAENARHELAGHENAAPCCRGGKCERWICGTNFQGWKMRDMKMRETR